MAWHFTMAVVAQEPGRTQNTIQKLKFVTKKKYYFTYKHILCYIYLKLNLNIIDYRRFEAFFGG